MPFFPYFESLSGWFNSDSVLPFLRLWFAVLLAVGRSASPMSPCARSSSSAIDPALVMLLTSSLESLLPLLRLCSSCSPSSSLLPAAKTM
jgi:hypothetical protein